MDHLTGSAALDHLAPCFRYDRRVFLAPPWPALFAADAERRHGLDAAIAEHDRLAAAYPALGYEVISLPRTSVAKRAAFILELIAVS